MIPKKPAPDVIGGVNRFSDKIMRHEYAQVTLRLDREMLDFFQADGPGWQERINTALRWGRMADAVR